MTVILDLAPELEQELQAEAKARGVSVEHFIRDLISKQVCAPARRP